MSESSVPSSWVGHVVGSDAGVCHHGRGHPGEWSCAERVIGEELRSVCMSGGTGHAVSLELLLCGVNGDGLSVGDGVAIAVDGPVFANVFGSSFGGWLALTVAVFSVERRT